MKATEQRANLLVRLAWDAVDKARRLRDAQQRICDTALDATTADAEEERRTVQSDLADARHALERAIGDAGDPIRKGIDLLGKLVALEPSLERESLLGSAYKRQALIAAIAGAPDDEMSAIAAMKEHYEKAAVLGREGKLDNLFCPALNGIAAEVILSTRHDRGIELDPKVITAVRECLLAKTRDDPDFWSIAGQTELTVYEAIASRDLSSPLDSILRAYDDLHGRLGQGWMWSSIYDQANFVLPKYIERAPNGERTAAEELLNQLRSFAGD